MVTLSFDDLVTAKLNAIDQSVSLLLVVENI